MWEFCIYMNAHMFMEMGKSAAQTFTISYVSVQTCSCTKEGKECNYTWNTSCHKGSDNERWLVFMLCYTNSCSYLWSLKSLDQNTPLPRPCYKRELWNSYTWNQILSLKQMKVVLDIKIKGYKNKQAFITSNKLSPQK